MRQFAVHFLIRKGLGPDHMPHTVFVGLDDLPEDMSESEIKQTAIYEAERNLRNTEDYPLYGQNWIYQSIENC